VNAVKPRTADQRPTRNLVIVLGDQLDANSAAFDGFDPACDAVLQMEVMEEASYVRQHKKRIAFFFSAMRHFRVELEARGRSVRYVELADPQNTGRLAAEIARAQRELKPVRSIVLEPGDWRVREMLSGVPEPPEVRADRHFLCSSAQFAEFVEAHPRLIMETFYRFMRRRTGILMDRPGKPAGGAWNFDAENRRAFGKHQQPAIPARKRVAPDRITQDVLRMVERTFAESPGHLRDFDLPVSRADALSELRDFVDHRLPLFGTYQDAMRGGEPLLYHSQLSGPLNLHMITPLEVVDAALAASTVPLNSREGFVRQIIGWREFVRGIYWKRMPDYAAQNALNAELPMPRFYWTGETEMRCLSEAIGHTIDHAYAHHIERLMVLGLFAMLLGVRPYDVHLWHMSMFSDAIDWVSLPNTLGMSQHGDGGVVGTKPYAASGNYIDRMSDHCRHCRYDPKKADGEDACPFTTLYWSFLARHRKRLSANGRMRNQYLNLDRKTPGELRAIRSRADKIAAALL
jgi:deoxyribodipyrimidine photolyase-related protein